MILRVVDEQGDGKIRAREHGSPQMGAGRRVMLGDIDKSRRTIAGGTRAS
jgi:hypothetical protein